MVKLAIVRDAKNKVDNAVRTNGHTQRIQIAKDNTRKEEESMKGTPVDTATSLSMVCSRQSKHVSAGVYVPSRVSTL
jgi:hypothetical protein